MKKLASVVSWIGFLASAVSEHGFDVDFPLTLARRSLGVGGPSLWVAIAFCVMLATGARAADNSWTDGSSKWETPGNWSLNLAPCARAHTLAFHFHEGMTRR